MKHVFYLSVGIGIGEDFDDAFERRVQSLLDRAAVALKKHSPKRERDGLVLTSSDYRLGMTLLDWVKRENQGYNVSETSNWDVASIVHARYVWLTVQTGGRNQVDLDHAGDPLNVCPIVLCQECGWADETVTAEPYKVWGPAVQGGREIFYAHNARFIVDERVLELLLGVVRGQIQWGPAVRVGGEKKNAEDLFWFRPKAVTGKDVTMIHEEVCKKCGVPLTCWRDATLGIGSRFVVDGFGDPKNEVAALGSWYGTLTDPGGSAGILRNAVISGGLFAYLYNCGVKGLTIPEGGVYSTKGEAAIEPERRLAHLNMGKEDKILRKKIKSV